MYVIDITNLLVLISLKDVPDVDGDRKFDIQTLSVIVGRERVSKLGKG